MLPIQCRYLPISPCKMPSSNLCTNTQPNQFQESLLRLGGGDLDRETELLYLLFLIGLALSSLSFPFPFPFLGGDLESLLARLGGGDGDRDTLLECLRLLGGEDLDTDSDGLRPLRFSRIGGGVYDTENCGLWLSSRRFGGGGGERERDTESDGLRPRGLGGGERERLDE